MDKELYIRKIAQLSDDKLKALLKLRTKENAAIMAFAESEAIKRGINPQEIEVDKNRIKTLGAKSKKSEGVNWLSILANFLSGL